jgi:alkylhydroperoxidase family enzyme
VDLEPHRARLAEAGLAALDIQQAVQVCAAYAMFNRLALALGVDLEPEFLP